MTKDFPYMRKYNYMRNFVNQKTRILQPSGIRKFFDIVRETEGAISLGVGEPDFVTPWPAAFGGDFFHSEGLHAVHGKPRHGAPFGVDFALSRNPFFAYL